MTDSETLKDISKQIADLLVKQSEIQDTILKAELSKIDIDIAIMVKICIGIKSFLLMNVTVLF